MEFFKNIIKGLFIGAGAIAPGVSGGVLAVIMGVYEKMTTSLSNLFIDFKKSFLYLLPLGMGGVAGIFFFSNIMEYLFIHFNIEVRFGFIGLMIGTFPSLLRTANKKGFKKSYLFLFILTLGMTILFSVLEGRIAGGTGRGGDSFFHFLLYGAVVGLGSIVPGLSSSVMLIYLGAYEELLSAISTIDIKLLVPIGIGFVLSFLVIAKALSYLFEKAYGLVYYLILGFVVGSIIPIFPGFSFERPYLIGFLLMIIGIIGVVYLSEFEENK
ncbi:DUF368 domain-containing protein [Jeotgalibaca sp. MA1X17-3]|uniref:DUF368 domain-containing protein n=1 Tax=Jeotgalibaca sp. MA1X17-3 TaxID=2908211 RepID=UPI001F20460E|nr:DUF368 domain-containing protein [Jeotgalibaca sp. MA1X17-3]UJF15744.1 DUF368 domain-containing protein [Jeotgalibaca sp. MA1X17-3]